MQNTIPETHLRKEAAAAYLSMSLSTFNALCKKGDIKAYSISPKKIFFKKSELDRLLETAINH